MDFSDTTLLFVEDDISSRATIELHLKSFNFEKIYVAVDGADGLEQYKKYAPDIVLTDYIMPTCNGLEMTQKIRSFDNDAIIILITSAEDNKTLIEAINIGVDGYIFKPFKKTKAATLFEKFAKRINFKKSFQKKQKILECYKGAIDASAAVSKTDPQGIITYVNDSFCEMSGYSPDELIGKKHSVVKHPDTPHYVYLEMWETITNQEVWQGRIKNLKKDGSIYYEYAVIVPVVNEDNKIEEYIALRQDITDLYHQEKYLKKRIEEEVDKNLQLHKEKEEAHIREEKFSIIGKMSAGITHEINTPLTYVKGNLELMMNDIDSLDDGLKQKEYLKEDATTLLDGLNRMASIVESMREMASQSKELPETHNIYSSLVTALTLAYNKSKFIANIKLQEEVFNIGIDKNKYNFEAIVQKQRIEQVFIIIINNALDVLKLMDDFDSREFKIFVKEEDNYVVVCFQDNAGGIAEDILPKIFDPFESNKEDGGIGIGLNVAKKIVDDHNGKIIPSNVNGGALFKVYLPSIPNSELMSNKD